MTASDFGRAVVTVDGVATAADNRDYDVAAGQQLAGLNYYSAGARGGLRKGGPGRRSAVEGGDVPERPEGERLTLVRPVGTTAAGTLLDRHASYPVTARLDGGQPE